MNITMLIASILKGAIKESIKLVFHVLIRSAAEEPFKPLHVGNPTRLVSIRSALSRHFRDRIEYSTHIDRLGTTLFELLSKALGVNSNHLKDLGCTGEHTLQCHYYPPCPQPEQTMGISKHTNPCFFTILLQDTEGHQFLYQNKYWIDVPPVDGALVIIIKDLLQLLRNDMFKSAAHRAVVKNEGPRISVAAFYKVHHMPRMYGPIKELTSEDNPRKCGEIIGNEYVSSFRAKGLDGVPPLQSLKL